METAGCLTAPTEPGPVFRSPGGPVLRENRQSRKRLGFNFTAVLRISMRLNRRNSERPPAWTKNYPRKRTSPVLFAPRQFMRTLSPQAGYECRGLLTFRADDS